MSVHQDKGKILRIKMASKQTLAKEASEILPEISLLTRALSGDVFENLCSKPDIELCADKAKSLGQGSSMRLGFTAKVGRI